MFERDAIDMRRIAAGAGVVVAGIAAALAVSLLFWPGEHAAQRPPSAGPGLETAPLEEMQKYRREKQGEMPAFEQRLGARVALEAPLVDDRGRRVSLGEAMDAHPSVLVLGYLGCHDLCPVAVTGVDEALRASGLRAPRDYRALFVSIDPRDSAVLGERKAERLAPGARDAWTFLGGDAKAVHDIARSVGFRYARDDEHDAFAHAAGFVVLTPQGDVSRYFFGVRFEPSAVANALRTAGRGRAGALAERLVMLCYHFDPATGRYSLAILDILRALAAVTVAAAAAWIWSRR